MKTCICEGSAGLKRFNKDSPDMDSHFRNLNKNGFQQVFDSFGTFDYLPGDTLVQEYVPEIVENGEVSLFYFGGKFSHAVSKKPKPGDFRAHSIWGAEVSVCKPSEEEITVGLDCLEVVGHPIEYARIDYIPTSTGPKIIEVELIDPAFFFDHVPETIKSFANHVENFLNQ
jgi:glutathione synthase/RimK-type ligase-like ATP-grasp enzyme